MTIHEPRPRNVVTVATLLAGALAAYRLGDKSFWTDEGYTISHAISPPADFFRVLVTREANAAVHSLLEFGLVRVSTAEWWVRLPSALAFTASVPLTYLLVRRLFSPRIGAFASVLVSVNAFALEFGQEARTYALFLAWSTLATWLFVRYVQQGDRRAWWAWVVAASLLGYLHFFGLLILAAHFFAVFVLRPAGVRAQGLWRGFLVIGLASLPLVVFVAVFGGEGQSVGIPGFTPMRFVGVFVRLAGNGAIVAVLVALSCLAALRSGRSRGVPWRALSEDDWGLALLFTVLVLPVIVMSVLAPAVSLFGARYFITGVSPLAGITALGVARVGRRQLRVGLAAALVVASAVPVGILLRDGPIEDVDGALADLSGLFEPGDAAVFLPQFHYLTFNAYSGEYPKLRRLSVEWPLNEWGTFDADHSEHPASGDHERVAEADRVWFFLRDGFLEPDQADLDAFVDALEPDHALAFEDDYTGFRVVRYDRR